MFDLISVEGRITYFCCALTFWTGSFLLVNKYVKLPSFVSKHNTNDLKNRIVSIMHGLTILFLTGYHIYRDNPTLIQPSTEIQHLAILTSCAYFFYDTIACHYYGLTDFSLYFHHAMCVIGCFYAEYINNSTIPILGLFWAEISNAPMHVRVILRIMKMRYTKLFEFAETFYIVSVTYVICRGIFASHLAITSALETRASYVLRALCLGIWLQSVYFIYEMYFIVLKKIKQHKERQQKNIPYYWFSENPKLSQLSYFNAEGKQKIF